MGATPTHQAKTQEINTNIWSAKESGGGELALPVPFWVPDLEGSRVSEGMLRVERSNSQEPS